MNLAKCSMSVVVVAFLLFLPEIYAAGAQGRNFGVSVKVSANESLKSLIVKEMLKELRSTADVSVVDSMPEWTLRIVAIGGKEIVISYTISETLYHQRLGSVGFKMERAAEEYIKKNYPDAVIKPPWEVKPEFPEVFLDKYPSYSDIYMTQGVMIGELQELNDLCKKIVASFDVNFLEPVRKEFQTLDDVFKKALELQPKK